MLLLAPPWSCRPHAERYLNFIKFACKSFKFLRTVLQHWYVGVFSCSAVVPCDVTLAVIIDCPWNIVLVTLIVVVYLTAVMLACIV